MPRLYLLSVLLLTWGAVGCGPRQEAGEPEEETCAPTEWDEAAVRNALAAQLESSAPSHKVRPSDLEVRALLWDEGGFLEDPQAAGADPAGSKALIWAKGEEHGYLASLHYLSPAEGGQIRFGHVRTFGPPDPGPSIRSRSSAQFEPPWGRWMPSARAVRPVALRGRSPSISATVCSSAWHDMLGTAEGSKDGSSSRYDLGWLYEYLRDPVELGARIYTAQACNTCHSIDGSDKVGPSLAGLVGAPRPLLSRWGARRGRRGLSGALHPSARSRVGVWLSRRDAGVPEPLRPPSGCAPGVHPLVTRAGPARRPLSHFALHGEALPYA